MFEVIAFVGCMLAFFGLAVRVRIKACRKARIERERQDRLCKEWDRYREKVENEDNH